MKFILVGAMALIVTISPSAAEDQKPEENAKKFIKTNSCWHNGIRYSEGATICYHKDDHKPATHPHACNITGDGKVGDPYRFRWTLISNAEC